MENEIILRLSSFFGILVVVAIWEYLRPKRNLNQKKIQRWVRNLSLVVLGSIAVRVIVPFTAASVAIYAQQYQIGLLYYLPVPFVITIIASVMLLDLVIYTQHRMFHHTPILWRLHKVHHIDQDIDVTTGVRFHPIEILLSTLIKSTAVLVLGVPFIAVVIFEILLNATAMFNHGNISLPERVDKWLRHIIVTPDMHRVHHSIIVNETSSNFGFNLPWWDKLFGTYIAQPENGHIKMQIGLKEYRDVSKTGLLELITIPFHKNNL